jgi:lipase chaperone LimK
MRSRLTWALLSCSIAALMSALLMHTTWRTETSHQAPAPSQPALTQRAPWPLPGAQFGQVRAGPWSNTAPPLEQIRDRLFKRGSLAGTQPAGNWCVAGSRLSPCPGLRLRFDYYLLGLGEVGIHELRALVEDDATQACGHDIAVSIMALWDAYWQLSNFTGQHTLDQADRSTWMPAWEEQRQARRRLLGPQWAQAFFEEDERQFAAMYAQLESGFPKPADPGAPVPQLAPGGDDAAVRAERVARFGQAAADRLAKVDEDWADWESRLAKAREELTRLKAAPNLSDQLRMQSMHAYIQANFKKSEHVRVEALLNL